MTKTKKKRRKMKVAQGVETKPDGWQQFTKAVGKIVPPKRRTSTPKPGK